MKKIRGVEEIKDKCCLKIKEDGLNQQDQDNKKFKMMRLGHKISSWRKCGKFPLH